MEHFSEEPQPIVVGYLHQLLWKEQIYPLSRTCEEKPNFSHPQKKMGGKFRRGKLWLHLKARPRLLIFTAVPLSLREHVAVKPHKYVVPLVVERHHLPSIELGFLENTNNRKDTIKRARPSFPDARGNFTIFAVESGKAPE